MKCLLPIVVVLALTGCGGSSSPSLPPDDPGSTDRLTADTEPDAQDVADALDWDAELSPADLFEPTDLPEAVDPGLDSVPGDVPIPTCVTTRFIEGRTLAPSAVALFFMVNDCQGKPVSGLKEGDFAVTEDGTALSVEAARTILPSKGLQVFVSLLLDMSSSTASLLPQLVAAAKGFVNTLMVEKGLPVQISIELFAGSADTTRWQFPNLDASTVLDKLDALSTYTPTDPSSTNLYGAVIEALGSLKQAEVDFETRNHGGAVTTGFLVLFTDGKDTAAYRTETEALAAIGQQAGDQVVVVGLKSADYDAASLQNLAPNGVVTANDSTQLASAFDTLAKRVAADLEGVYLLGYCSPKRNGAHTVTVAVKGRSNSTGYTFDSTGFTEGCTLTTFHEACIDKECGGLVCGACDDRMDVCDGGSDTCVDYCEALPACEYITNPIGYPQNCPGCGTGFVCDGYRKCVCKLGTLLCGDGTCHECCNDRDCSIGQTCDTASHACIIPSKLVGSYDVTTTLNMVSGLPPQVAVVINYIIDFLDSPTGATLKLMCDPAIWGSGGSALQGLCSNIFVDTAHPDINNLTTIGTIAKDIMDANVKTLLESQCPDKANPGTCSEEFGSVQNVGDILRKLTLWSTMTCTKEPDPTGLIALGGCSEKWHTVVIRWTLGKSCGSSDPTCGDVPLSLASMPGLTGAITADIEARLVEKNTKLAITRHPVDLKYGALLDFVLEKVLLPQVFGDGSDGLPAVDSFEAMIGSLLAGNACLAINSCCHDFAVNLVRQTGGALGINLVEGACDSLITTGGNYVRKFLTGLDTTTGNFTIGTPVADGAKYPTDQPCAFADKNSDMKFDALGGQPADQQCVWDVMLTLGGFDYHPEAIFYGIRE